MTAPAGQSDNGGVWTAFVLHSGPCGTWPASSTSSALRFPPVPPPGRCGSACWTTIRSPGCRSTRTAGPPSATSGAPWRRWVTASTRAGRCPLAGVLRQGSEGHRRRRRGPGQPGPLARARAVGRRLEAGDVSPSDPRRRRARARQVAPARAARPARPFQRRAMAPIRDWWIDHDVPSRRPCASQRGRLGRDPSVGARRALPRRSASPGGPTLSLPLHRTDAGLPFSVRLVADVGHDRLLSPGRTSARARPPLAAHLAHG